jgi:hypothetical protein
MKKGDKVNPINVNETRRYGIGPPPPFRKSKAPGETVDIPQFVKAEKFIKMAKK